MSETYVAVSEYRFDKEEIHTSTIYAGPSLDKAIETADKQTGGDDDLVSILTEIERWEGEEKLLLRSRGYDSSGEPETNWMIHHEDEFTYTASVNYYVTNNEFYNSLLYAGTSEEEARLRAEKYNFEGSLIDEEELEQIDGFRGEITTWKNGERIEHRIRNFNNDGTPICDWTKIG